MTHLQCQIFRIHSIKNPVKILTKSFKRKLIINKLSNPIQTQTQTN